MRALQMLTAGKRNNQAGIATSTCIFGACFLLYPLVWDLDMLWADSGRVLGPDTHP